MLAIDEHRVVLVGRHECPHTTDEGGRCTPFLLKEVLKICKEHLVEHAFFANPFDVGVCRAILNAFACFPRELGYDRNEAWLRLVSWNCPQEETAVLQAGGYLCDDKSGGCLGLKGALQRKLAAHRVVSLRNLPLARAKVAAFKLDATSKIDRADSGIGTRYGPMRYVDSPVRS